MFRRVIIALLLATSLLAGVACKSQKAANPLAQINSKQPDKVLFDRAMQALKDRKYDTARLTLQTLINTYPDSEYVARAKLMVGESWYREGTPAAYTQAETEFRDFITFFPNMPEAAEAQLKIADIHYRQMEKPDRDYTHARRAEEEYRQMLLQYPDSKLVDTARVRLLQVQEVLAEREFRIARFYYLRGSLLAAIARAKTLTDSYPLYSRSDEALYILGQSYEQQVEQVRNSKLTDAVKKQMIDNDLSNAAAAYSKIVTRYPAMPRYQDARRRLTAMQRPVPTPTPEAVAQNKKELASRTATTRYERFVNDMSRRPDLNAAIRMGEPTLVDPKATDAPSLVREINSMQTADKNASAGTGKVALETLNTDGKVAESQPAPRAAETAVNSSDVPAEAPSQLDESKSTSSDDAASSSSSTTNTTAKDDNASSSRKQKKKHHIHVPSPF
jgi:outer membrane protein assembly factor BamD